ncbi:DUF4328 domain-containing protein [Streptomyces sp. NPDC060198]|uniref:DUF4328 domain-containing protein n=1 Tax=Streptomyces sp. NPDC060198 TaxID=3347070 RepID=UPI00365FCA45
MSDFSAFPEQSLPYGVPPYQAPARAPEGLLKAVVVLLGLVALTDLFAVFADLKIVNLVGDGTTFVAVSTDDLDAADTLYTAAGLLQFVAFIACAVVFLVWFFQMRTYIGVLAQDAFEQGAGWAIGSWFIPFGALWMPFRIAKQMWNAATRTSGSEPARYPSSWPVGLWWSLFVLSTVAGWFVARGYDDADSLLEVRDAALRIAVVDGLDALAAAAAVYFAIRLSALHRRPAPEPGFASPDRPGGLAT